PFSDTPPILLSWLPAAKQNLFGPTDCAGLIFRGAFLCFHHRLAHLQMLQRCAPIQIDRSVSSRIARAMLRSKLRQNRRSQTAAARKNFSQRGEAFPCPDRDFLATVSSAAAPDYSRYATSITETGPVHVLGVLAEERFAAASTAVIARDATSAELPGRRARLI